MMREILFRAKKEIEKDPQRPRGTWVFGYYVQVQARHCIFDSSDLGVYVLPETLGQFLGLWDINGRRMFEGDIVTIKDRNLGGVVYTTSLQYWQGNVCINTLTPLYPYNTGAVVEVVGNIHDDPELLKQGAVSQDNHWKMEDLL